MSLFDPFRKHVVHNVVGLVLNDVFLAIQVQVYVYSVWNMEHVHMCDYVAIPVRITVLGWVAGSGWSREFSLIAYPGHCPKLRLHINAPRSTQI